jgi:hypothetical protein
MVPASDVLRVHRIAHDGQRDRFMCRDLGRELVVTGAVASVVPVARGILTGLHPLA